MKYNIILIIILILSNLCFSQESIWEENFDNQINKGVWGDGKGGVYKNLDGVNWALNYTNCKLNDTQDYLKVDKHYAGGRFEARDCDGEAIWESSAINILKYENINISLTIGETGNSNKKEKKYIEVYALIDGKEKLFTTNGRGLGNFSKLKSSTIIKKGKNLKIRIKLRTDYAQDVYFDDIKVTGKKQTNNLDTNSEITLSDSPTPNQTIIATESSNKLHEVFRFRITDKGTGDQKPTTLTSITLNKHFRNTIDWTKELTKATLNTATANILGVISKNTIIFQIPEGLDIKDNSSQEFSLKIRTAKHIKDFAKFIVQINANHDFKTDNKGSSLSPTLTNPIIANTTTFDVQATQLRFSIEPPASIARNRNFTVEIQATDKNKNIDKDFSEKISLYADNLEGITSSKANAGIANFSELRITTPSTHAKLSAVGGKLKVSSTDFSVTDSFDATSIIQAIATPIAKRIMPGETSKVFNFKIADIGGDSFPTKVTQIVITPAASNQLRWKEVLQKITFKSNGVAIPTKVNITNSSIILNFEEGSLTIAEGTNSTCSLIATLATAKIEESKKLSFQITSEGHRAKSAITQSSRFANNFDSSIISAAIQTEVEATKIYITQQPSQETAGQVFSSPILAQLADNYGNIDTNNTLKAIMTVASGSGSLFPTSSLSQAPTNGQYTWKTLYYNRAEVATFKTETERLTATTAPISFARAQSTLIKNPSVSTTNDTILSSRNTAVQAKDFFKFSIKDQGDDGLPTILQAIRLKKATNFTQPKLYHLLGGIILKQKDETIGKIDTLNSSNGVEIEIPLKTPLTIKDGKETEVTVSIFVSKNKKVEEGEKIQLAIPPIHQWKTAKEGTDLESPLQTNISSPILTIDATATKLVFEQIPKSIVPNIPFSAIIAAVDNSGIIDKNYNATVMLSREAGTGTLSSASGLSLQFTNGKAIWKDLKYNTGESFTLLASSTNLPPTESKSISANDTDSKLQASTQITPNRLMPSTITKGADAQAVFAFSLQDKGTSDSKPTILSQIIFKNAHPPNGANWKKNIAGAVLLQNGTVVAATDKISSEEIKFRNTNGITTIADGSTANLSLAIHLKHNNIEDNKTFQCKIVTGNNSIKTHSTGSSLQKIETEILSTITTIDVTASKVVFLEAPYAISSAKASFTVRLAARDTNGNIDTDYIENITIKDSSIIASAKFTNGIASFSNIQQNGDTDFTLLAESNKLQTTKRQVIISPIFKDLEESFEDKSLQGWFPTKDWKASVVKPISGNYSLKHNLINTIGTSNISKSIGNFKLQNSTTIWRWQMKNGDWNPSSSNNFCYVLASTDQNLLRGISYVVGIKQSTSNNLLTLSKIENGNATILLSSEMTWQESEQVGIQVKLDNKGSWELAYDNNGGFDNLYMTGATMEKPSLSGELFTGCIFNYGAASRAGQFWVDAIKIYHFNTAPEVKKLKVVSETKLAITFSEEMKKASCEQPNNYLVNNNIRTQEAKQTAPDTVVLTTSQLKTGSYSLKIKNLESLTGMLLADTTLAFEYFATAQKGEVILNELMIDELPTVELPTYEYIELFNKASKPFILKGWAITIGKYKKMLPPDTIQPKQYLLLCSPSAQKALSAYGKAIVINGLSSLPNSSGRIALKNEKGIEVDQINYEKSWYNDKEKERGGWSLERISSESPSNSRANWAASKDKRGGTPGAKNSVNGIIIDNTPPVVENIIPIDHTHIKVTFNEPIDTLAIQRRNLFFVNGIGHPQQVDISQNTKQIILRFSESFEYGKIYQLAIKEVIDLFGNALENTQISFGLPELALSNEIIINEILFNPAPNNVDYVELYNRSNKIIDLATLFIATRDSKGNLKTVTSLSKSPRLLKPTEFVVLTTNAKSVMEQYEVKNPQAILEIKSLPKLPNKEGVVLILNQESKVIDEFHYTEKMHLKLLNSKRGVSLERIHYSYPTQDTNNWHSAAQVVGFGTPTYTNSSYSELKAFDTNIYIAPKIFSPNGDGIDDIMQIHYKFDNPKQIANVSIFDSSGRLIRDIARNLTLGAKGVITWDGLNANNKRAHTGRYIIFIQLFDENGNISSYKKNCILHGHFR